jgi:hypothetical protein
MPDIGSTSITVYNDTSSQNETVSSLRTYQTGNHSLQNNSLINISSPYSISYTI